VFLQISFESSREVIEITPNHLIFLYNQSNNPIAASKLHIGDVLDAAGKHRVKHIQTIRRKGVYTPLTISGRVPLILGIEASCYVTIDPDHASYLTLAGSMIQVPVTFHTLGHVWFAPLRLMVITFGMTLSSSNKSYFLALSLEVANQLIRGNSAVQVGLFAALIVCLMPLVALEFVMDHHEPALFCVAVILLISSRKQAAKRRKSFCISSFEWRDLYHGPSIFFVLAAFLFLRKFLKV